MRSSRISIQAVLILCLLGTAALPVVFLSVQRYVWLTTGLLSSELEADVLLARSVGAGLTRYVQHRQHLINTLAVDIGRRGFHPGMSEELETARRHDPSFRTLVVTNRSGVAVAFSPPTDEQGRPNVGRTYADRDWFQRALREPPQPSYDVVRSRSQGGRPTVAVAAPIRSPAGAVLGVLSGGLNLEEIRESLNDVDLGYRHRIVVVDARGQVISHTSRQWEDEARDLSSEAVFKAAGMQPQGSLEYDSSYSKDRQWGSYVTLPATGWVVWVTRGPEHVAAKVRPLVRDLVLSSIVALVITLAAALALTRLLARPLQLLVEATQRFSAARFDDGQALAARRSGIREFDHLFRSFADMAQALRSQYQDLEAKVGERTQALETRTREAQATAALLRAQDEISRGYGELASLLNSLDRSHILNEGSRKIAAPLKAPLVAVYLTDNGTDSLRLKTYAGIESGLLEQSVLRAAGLPTDVARRGTPVILQAADMSERLTIETGVGSIKVASVAGLPLRHQDTLLGVLVVATLDPLTEQTGSFLDSAARQLSVALSNAGLFESVRFQSQQLEHLNRELQRASEVKSEFMASMSHELRTPLNSIIGFSEVLLTSTREPLTERQRGAIERVLGSGRHLLGLINDVLDLAKIEAGRMEVHAEDVAVGALVLDCVGTLEQEAQRKGLVLRTVGADNGPTIWQDPKKLKQILLNLLANAVKFTTEGSVEVRIGPEQDKHVVIAVADTGVGIRVEDQPAVFERFRQVGSTGKDDHGGTGLGLGISQRLAELMGGALTLSSEPGRGSVFTLVLPVRYGAAVTPAASGGVTAGATQVLVIDDDENAVEIVRQAVSDDDFQIEWAANASEGLARARTTHPAVILLDVILQGADDGWDVLTTLKADPATSDIPVLVYSVIDNADRARRLGAAGMLPKPMPIAAIAQHLKAFRTPQGASPRARA